MHTKQARSGVLRTTCALMLTLLQPACSPPQSAADVQGAYVANYAFGTDRIILRADGTFRQEIAVRSQQDTAVATGTWEYELTGHRVALGKVYLHGCMTFADGFGRMRPNYRELVPFCAYPLERENFVGPRMQLFADEEHAYKRE